MNNQPVGYKAKAFEARNLVIFVLVILGMTGVAVGFQLSPGGLPSGIPGAVLGVMFLLMPCITAFVLTAISEGKPGIKALWGRFWNRNLRLKWLLVVLLTFPAFWLIVNLVYRTQDRQDYPVFALPDPPWTLITMFITYFIYAMGEEFGWRGYVLPRFQARWNALASSIILGVIWAAWHWGQWFVPGSNLYQRNFWLWSLGTILLSILITWIFNNTNGSVLAASLFHGMVNTGTFWFQLDWRYYVIELLAVTLIVIIFGPSNLVREKPEPAETLTAVKVTSFKTKSKLT